MRLAVLLAALLVVAPAAAQPPTFTQAYQARIAFGDIPTTPEAEGAGWNVLQKLRVAHAAGNDTLAPLRVPVGMNPVAAACTCGPVTAQADGVLIPASAPTGEHEVTLLANQASQPVAGGQLFAPRLAIPVRDAVVILYAPEGHEGDALAQSPGRLGCTQGGCTITWYTGTAAQPLPDVLQVYIRPASTVAAPAPAEPWMLIAAAFLLGILVWAFLVRQGFVQKRSRRQVVAEAAHETIAAEPKPILEARKRALMAALKEVEVAKMNQEIDAATYDSVKAEFKKQAVTVMRAIEEGKQA
jgi:hypothetical protein